MPFTTHLVCRLQNKEALTILESAPEGANVAPHLSVLSLERRQDAERHTLDTLSQGLESQASILQMIKRRRLDVGENKEVFSDITHSLKS